MNAKWTELGFIHPMGGFKTGKKVCEKTNGSPKIPLK